MPYIYDEERWDEVAPGVHIRRVDGERKGPDATEAAIKIAIAYGVDLSEVEGSGSGGRITKWDVERYLTKDDK